ncbi:MAG TPA: hypothetical protein VEH07_10600 [Alphaproteobacteria bacterium]|nr:hypothetical protein [Alphaproteobacteria bacterium]
MTPREVIETYIADLALHLPPKTRADIACELHALLNEELRAREERAGRLADEAMARSLIAEFGSPADLAARYRPAGFIIIPAENSRAFLQAATIGVIILWTIGVADAVVHVNAGAPAYIMMQKWFFSWGLGALWWPGFLVTCAAAASWLKQRQARRRDAGMEPVSKEKIGRIGAGVGLPFAVFFTLFYAAPGWFVGHIAPPGFNTSWITYAEEFRTLRLPALILYMTANLALLSFVTFKGHESRVTRRLAIATEFIGVIVMTWCAVGGAMFALPAADILVRVILAIIAFCTLISLVQRVAREVILMR